MRKTKEMAKQINQARKRGYYPSDITKVLNITHKEVVSLNTGNKHLGPPKNSIIPLIEGIMARDLQI